MGENGCQVAQQRIEEARKRKHLGLNLSNLGLIKLPPEIYTLITVQRVNLSENNLEDLSEAINLIPWVIQLKLCNNAIVSLPAELAGLRDLEVLDLKGNRLTTLPPVLTELRSLEALSLADNQLLTLSPEIARLHSLEFLRLDNNRLVELPREIGLLNGLEGLQLRRNSLASLPRELGALRRLAEAAVTDKEPFTKGLFLEDNPLPAPYPQLITPGQPEATRNVLAWLRGELDPDTLPAIPQTDETEEDATPPPAPPAQTAGPHFVLDADGRVVFAPAEALDADGNNLALLRALHPTVRALADSLATRLGAGNAPHAVLARLLRDYRALVGQDLKVMEHGQLYAAGVLLEEAWKAAQR